MVRKKPMWVRNDIVYDPNIDYPSVFDIEYEDVEENKTQYHAGKGKKKRYTGV